MTPTTIEFAQIFGTDSFIVTRVDPPLILKSRQAGVMVVDKLSFSNDEPLVLVMPSLNGVDTVGKYFRIDLGKADQFILDEPPVTLNPKARTAIYDFCNAAVGLIRKPDQRRGISIKQLPALSL